MSILKILQYPDPRLRRKALHVVDPTSPKIQRIIDDILETLHHTESCAGLAATQLDIDEPPRIAILSPTENLKEHLCLINPKIIETSGKISELEGCMSVFPKDIAASIERAQQIKMQALDRYGKNFEINAHDFLAKLIQHEIDHLDGMVFLDRLSSLKRALIKKKIVKLQQYKKL